MAGCQLAEWRAEKAMEQAAQAGRKIRDSDIVNVLDAWKFRRNDKRANVIPDGQGFVMSEMLGLVCIRTYSKLMVAHQTRKFPKVTRLLCQFLHDNPPQGMPKGARFPFTTICINKDYAARRHRDKNNTGLSIVRAVGDYQGGRLKYWPGDLGPKAVPDVQDLKESDKLVLDVRGRSVALDSTKAHEVEPFTGRRYSIVYFTIPRIERCDRAMQRRLSRLCGLDIWSLRTSRFIWRQVPTASGGQDRPGSTGDGPAAAAKGREQREAS